MDCFSPFESWVVETMSEAFVLSCLRALDRFEILAVARSGAVALETGAAEGGLAPTHP